MADKLIKNDSDFKRMTLAKLGVHADPLIPPSKDAWETLKALDEKTLVDLGCRVYCGVPDEDWNIVLQIPAEWYDYVPDGFALDGTNDRTEAFRAGTTRRSDGLLNFGIKIRSSLI